MNRAPRIVWRWAEKDLGFRFRTGTARSVAEYYQASKPAEFYHVPASQRKLDKDRLDELAALLAAPTSPTIVATPWQDYSLSDIQRIHTSDGLCLNWAGCLSQEEINERETNGVNRAKEFVAELALRAEPAPITIDLVRRIHTLMFGDIYPWAGQWRTVSLHKGDGPTKWPVPPMGMEPLMEQFAQQVLSRTPFLSEDNEILFSFLAELIGEYLALHPFREGNGRSAFILSELVLLQNGMLPLNEYNRRRDQDHYYAACEDARLRKDYRALAAQLAEWEAEAQSTFTDSLGQGEN
jgi:cell filamentation protein